MWAFVLSGLWVRRVRHRLSFTLPDDSVPCNFRFFACSFCTWIFVRWNYVSGRGVFPNESRDFGFGPMRADRIPNFSEPIFFSRRAQAGRIPPPMPIMILTMLLLLAQAAAVGPAQLVPRIILPGEGVTAIWRGAPLVGIVTIDSARRAGPEVRVLEDSIGFANTALQFLVGSPTNPNPAGAEYVSTGYCGHDSSCVFAQFSDWFAGSLTECQTGAGGVFGAPTSMSSPSSFGNLNSLNTWWSWMSYSSLEPALAPSVTSTITFQP
jgi:hypothetical protein